MSLTPGTPEFMYKREAPLPFRPDSSLKSAVTLELSINRQF
jgi:hypothetical protein